MTLLLVVDVAVVSLEEGVREGQLPGSELLREKSSNAVFNFELGRDGGGGDDVVSSHVYGCVTMGEAEEGVGVREGQPLRAPVMRNRVGEAGGLGLKSLSVLDSDSVKREGVFARCRRRDKRDLSVPSSGSSSHSS